MRPREGDGIELGVNIDYCIDNKKKAPAHSEIPRLLRREAPRKRCPGGREYARGAFCYTSQLRIGEWNCGGLSNVTMTMCKDLGLDILALSETKKEEARNHTIDVVMKRGTEDGAGWDTSYAFQSTTWCAKFC